MQCRICGSEAEHRLHVAREMMLGLRDEHRYFECADCGCLQIENIPDNLPDYYPKDYYSYNSASQNERGLQHLLIKMRDNYAATRQNQLGRILNFLSPNAKLQSLQATGIRKHSRVLDVGCGAGHLLNSLRATGFTHLLGIDPFNQADITYPNGLRIEKRDIFSEQEAWDLVMFHHSFEHLPDQHANLKQAFNILKPGGMALVRIPTVSSWAWQEYGVNWVQLDAPRHLYLHSLNSMQQLAAQCGFTIERVSYDSNALQFWGSQQYEQDIPLRSARSWSESPENSLFTAKQIRQFESRARELNAINQGDQAAFYLRKPA